MKENDQYRLLKLEFPGIKNVISKYSPKGIIGNYLNAMEEALATDSSSEVLYCLDCICTWYNENISQIISNGWVFNQSEHSQAKSMLESFKENLKDYDFSDIKQHTKKQVVKGNKIFIVHGHDNEAKIVVARMIEQLGFNAIILHEQPDMGKTIIEKLESFTADVTYAIILYTECDIGRSREKEESANKLRARQNVIFEHGLFVGSLGRKNVCALVKGDIEKPGDLDGIVYVPMDAPGAWKIQLCSNLKAAGFSIDVNKLI